MGAEVLAKYMIGFHASAFEDLLTVFAALRSRVHVAHPAELHVPLQHSEAISRTTYIESKLPFTEKREKEVKTCIEVCMGVARYMWHVSGRASCPAMAQRRVSSRTTEIETKLV